MNSGFKFARPLIASLLGCALLACAPVHAQDGRETDPASALSSALTAACRGNETQFANYLTADNAVAFRALPKEERSDLLKRFSLIDEAGKPLLSTDAQNHEVLRCEASGGSVEFRLGEARIRENLALIPITVVDGQQAQFGLVREGGGWRILSLGLVLLDIPDLSKQWAEQDMAGREDAIVTALHGLTEAIQRYKRAFGKLPDSLAQLGPAEPGQISPDQASLVSKDLASGTAGGYHFHYHLISTADPNNQTFELAATPDDYGKTGRKSFLRDGAGRIHAADKHGAPANGDDPTLESDNTQ